MSDDASSIIKLKKKQNLPPIIKTAAQQRAEMPRDVSQDVTVHKGPQASHNPLGEHKDIAMQNPHSIDDENYGATISENSIVYGANGLNVNQKNLAQKFQKGKKNIKDLENQKMTEMLAYLQSQHLE